MSGFFLTITPPLHVQGQMKQPIIQKAINRAKKTMGADDCQVALLACMAQGGEEGLEKVIELLNYLSENTEMPYESERACLAAVMYWGEQGLSRLASNALNRKGSLYDAIEVIAYASGGSLNHPWVVSFREELPKVYERLNFAGEQFLTQTFLAAAKQTLANLVVNADAKYPAPQHVLGALSHLSSQAVGDDFGARLEWEAQAAKEAHSVEEYKTKIANYTPPRHRAFENTLHAFLNRWFRINNKSLAEYSSLIHASDVREELVQNYLEKHPYILEPFYAHIWPKARLGENLIVDFLVRLMDDSYVVVEIERPGDSIMNRNGDLSAKASHAVRQALEYRDWLASNQLYARQRFENIWRPSCLVVIGMQSSLTLKQSERLKQENESRQGIIRIVGFDWLHHRAESIQNNIINHSVDRFNT